MAKIRCHCVSLIYSSESVIFVLKASAFEGKQEMAAIKRPRRLILSGFVFWEPWLDESEACEEFSGSWKRTSLVTGALVERYFFEYGPKIGAGVVFFTLVSCNVSA